MALTTGINKIGDYSSGTNKELVGKLLALIPNVDVRTGSSGGVAVPPTGVGNSYLDEMGPMCAAQLRVELLALQTAITNV